MRIALVYRYFHLLGSLPRFHVELARYLSGRGHDVHVYSAAAATEPRLAPGCTFHDVPVWAIGDGSRVSARELWSFARNAQMLVARERFDVIHVRAPSMWEADLLHLPGVMRGEAELQGLTYLRHIASTARHPGNAARLVMEHRALGNAHLKRINVDAPVVREHLERLYGIDPARVAVALPGVDLDVFRPRDDRRSARAEIGLPADDRFLALFCGHDFARKGLDRAIEAIAAMREPGELAVVGRCNEEARFRRLADERGVGVRVHFFGAQAAIERFFRAADAFLLPTRADIWGVTVVEAMATAVPPIVSDAAGAASVVDHGRCGFVIRAPASTRDLRDALDQLAASPDLQRRMGVAAREAARAFTWERHGRLVENELATVAEAIARTRRPPRSSSALTAAPRGGDRS